MSEVQQKLSFEFEDEQTPYMNSEEEELYSLLEQILIEVFVDEEEKETLGYLTGNAIYDLADERELHARERYAQEALDEGHPNVEEFEELLELAEVYFGNPKVYPLHDDSGKANQDRREIGNMFFPEVGIGIKDFRPES